MKIISFFYKFLSRIYIKIGYNGTFSDDGEDSILYKYFLEFKKGNYIDIGANHPIIGSNTFFFYLKNWRGICIDPLPFLKKKYRFFRPFDLFINSGILLFISLLLDRQGQILSRLKPIRKEVKHKFIYK